MSQPVECRAGEFGPEDDLSRVPVCLGGKAILGCSNHGTCVAAIKPELPEGEIGIVETEVELDGEGRVSSYATMEWYPDTAPENRGSVLVQSGATTTTVYLRRDPNLHSSDVRG